MAATLQEPGLILPSMGCLSGHQPGEQKLSNELSAELLAGIDDLGREMADGVLPRLNTHG